MAGKAKAQDEWAEVGGGNILVLNDENKSIEGTLMGIRPSEMYPDNKLYDFHTEDGPVALAGSSAINARINQTHVGKYMRVEFAGMARGKSGRQYKDFVIKVKQGGSNGSGPATVAEDPNEPPF